MIFSSQIFLFLFLPITLLGYICLNKLNFSTGKDSSKNFWLLLMSILFYSYGEPLFIYVLIGVLLLNWIISKFMILKEGTLRRVLLILAVVVDCSILVIYKYLSFIVGIVNNIFDVNIMDPQLRLPIGISFFSFQAISYIIDVYRGDADVANTPLEIGVYLLFFPQLIAGPIVRYKSIVDEIHTRKITMDGFSYGIERLVIGIGKKVLIANILGEAVDAVFAGNLESSVCLYWIGAICYMFQIYYDFSGYSDMAIGLGRMFGFHFMENFNYPYTSKSIAEFWKRWHISLSSWFRDYIYIPLGGSRVRKGRLIFNLLIVWSLTGIWHGASWTFIVWGIYYFCFLVIEKSFIKQIEKIPACIRYVFTMLVVLVGWVIFRSISLIDAIVYLKNMIGLGNISGLNDIAILYLRENFFVLMIATLFCFPITKYIKVISEKNIYIAFCYEVGKNLCLGIILISALSFLVKGAYNPFIYFNF